MGNLIDDRYEKLDSKSALDSDGFLTDYTLYYDYVEDNYICMFGDNEIYNPDPAYADYETENESEAWEWFESYKGFEDGDDEDIESCDTVEASTYGEEDFEGTDFQDDILSMRNELERTYYRLGALQDKWIDLDEVYFIQDATADVGAAFTRMNNILKDS